MSLTTAALNSKKVFFWALVIFAVIISVMTIMGIGKNVWRVIFPGKPTAATVAFGKLPLLDFSDNYHTGGTYNFELSTISGSFPNVGPYGKVFAISPPVHTFGAGEDVKVKAGNIGFSADPVQISGGLLKFTDPKVGNRFLTADATGLTFTLESDYFNNTDVLASRPESEKSAIDIASRFFERYGLDLADFPADKIETRKLRIDGTKLTETPALGSANLIQVNFHRANLDELPVVWGKAGDAQIWALVSGRDVVAAKAINIPILKNKLATYPLKSPVLAFEDLKNGLGAFNQTLSSTDHNILDISLGYVTSEKTKDFLEPVYIFKTEGGTLGFVSAVDTNWTGVSANK